ncbi:MAG: hypothetical protein M3066_01725, partial [Actinomycetota bacterium]|nr:hypothetical protein [Actinomycetota bacterium]
DAITYHQNNVFSNNRYVGDWHFAAKEAVGNPLTFAQWQVAPSSQDAGSTMNGGRTDGGHVKALR